MLCRSVITNNIIYPPTEHSLVEVFFCQKIPLIGGTAWHIEIFFDFSVEEQQGTSNRILRFIGWIPLVYALAAPSLRKSVAFMGTVLHVCGRASQLSRQLSTWTVMIFCHLLYCFHWRTELSTPLPVGSIRCASLKGAPQSPPMMRFEHMLTGVRPVWAPLSCKEACRLCH